MSGGNRTRTLDDSTVATDPGRITLSHKKLRELRPDLYGLRGFWYSLQVLLRLDYPQRTYIEEQLQCGDSRAAVVMFTRPLLIAAFTGDLDCVALLRFPSEFAHRYRLSEGSRLLTVNCYGDSPDYDADLIPGPNAKSRWTGFHPVIAEFVTEDDRRVKARKQGISEEEWQRAQALGKEYMRLRPGVARDGRPVFSSIPTSATY
jgi:hypothetical protein